jgi:hypothetical protein
MRRLVIDRLGHPSIHRRVSDARRELIRREEERERKAAEPQRSYGRTLSMSEPRNSNGWDIRHAPKQSCSSRCPGPRDRQDKADERRERESAEQLGLPEQRLDRWAMQREQREAAATPASQADLSMVASNCSPGRTRSTC